MNEQELDRRLASLEEKVDAIGEGVKKIRRQLIVRAVISFLLFVLPIVAILFSIPFLLDAFEVYSDLLSPQA